MICPRSAPTLSLQGDGGTIFISNKGIQKMDGKDTEVFTANGKTYDLTQKLDVSARITEDDIDKIFSGTTTA